MACAKKQLGYKLKMDFPRVLFLKMKTSYLVFEQVRRSGRQVILHRLVVR